MTRPTSPRTPRFVGVRDWWPKHRSVARREPQAGYLLGASVTSGRNLPARLAWVDAVRTADRGSSDLREAGYVDVDCQTFLTCAILRG